MKRTISLSTCKWEWSEAVETRLWRPCVCFPTVIHEELLAIKAISYPAIGTNELDVQWVGERDWTFRTEFQSPTDVRSFPSIYLFFGGLDTVATVTLNGKVILRADNMFTPYTVDVSLSLKDQDEMNELEILFESADRVAKERFAAQHGQRSTAITLGAPSRVYLRKAQYHWGWDWGEIFTVGSISCPC